MRVTTCCFCISLKTGCIIISIFYVMTSLMLIVPLYDILVVDEEDVTEKYGVKPEDPIIRGILWTFLAIIILHDIVSLVHVEGVMKEIRAIVLIWIIVDILFLAALAPGIISLRLYLGPRKFMAEIGKRVDWFIVDLAFLIVVKSFYSDLKERQNNDAESV